MMLGLYCTHATKSMLQTQTSTLTLTAIKDEQKSYYRRGRNQTLEVLLVKHGERGSHLLHQRVEADVTCAARGAIEHLRFGNGGHNAVVVTLPSTNDASSFCCCGCSTGLPTPSSPRQSLPDVGEVVPLLGVLSDVVQNAAEFVPRSKGTLPRSPCGRPGRLTYFAGQT